MGGQSPPGPPPARSLYAPLLTLTRLMWLPLGIGLPRNEVSYALTPALTSWFLANVSYASLVLSISPLTRWNEYLKRIFSCRCTTLRYRIREK